MPDDFEVAAARDDATQHSQLQRCQCPGSAVECGWGKILRARNSTTSQPTLFVRNRQLSKAHLFHCLTEERPGPCRWTSTRTSCKLTTSRRRKSPTRSINKALYCLRVPQRSASASMTF